MKKMTCKMLGGACEQEFQAETFDEMANLSKNHGMEMMNDKAHKEAMQKMKSMMQNPKNMQQWMDGKRAEFDALPDMK